MPRVTRDAKRGIVRSAARGAGLIGAAVILGIILLQVVDDGTGGPAGNGGNGGTPTVTTGANGTTDPTAPTDTRPPGEVRVLESASSSRIAPSFDPGRRHQPRSKSRMARSRAESSIGVRSWSRERSIASICVHHG